MIWFWNKSLCRCNQVKIQLYWVKAALIQWFIDGKFSPRHSATRTCWWELELGCQKLRNTSRGLLVMAIDRICPWGPQREHNPLSALTPYFWTMSTCFQRSHMWLPVAGALNISVPYPGHFCQAGRDGEDGVTELGAVRDKARQLWGTDVSAPHPWLGEEQEHKEDLASKFLASSPWVLGHSLLEQVAIWAGKGPC